ncbi:MAG: cupin domain-containing protein [Alphaproteobacteria bacterium]|nr:cupin domain-containing protein [Alphaproteobacteria bacterium]
MSSGERVQAPRGVNPFRGPTLVRHGEAVRFLWGDAESQQVNDIVYGRNERIACLYFSLRPGGFFRSSKTWKSRFDQHRFYYVVQGRLAIHDPERGDVAVAEVGEAVYWRGAKWHFGYNMAEQETIVIDWYAPQERPPDVPEVTFAKTKPDLGRALDGRDDLIGQWPAAAIVTRAENLRDGHVVTLGPRDALHRMHGTHAPVVEALYISTADITCGRVALRPGLIAEPMRHPGDKVIFVLEGRVNVHLPDGFDWFEVNRWDCLYLPGGTNHVLVNYTGEPAEVLFSVVPTYR